jgi:hypothetical protein
MKMLGLSLNYSQSELLYNLRFTANQFVLATSPLRLTTSNFIFQLNTCAYSPYVTSSLTRGWMSFTIAVGPRQHSYSPVRVPRDSRPHFTVFRFEIPPTWRARSPYLYPPGTGWPGYTPRHWVPFSSPPTTRREFDPASTRDYCL